MNIIKYQEIPLKANDKLSLSCGALSSGFAQKIKSGAVISTRNINTASSIELGPYTEDCIIKVVALSGSIDYTYIDDAEGSVEIDSNFYGDALSPHLVGWWKLDKAQYMFVRDSSPKRNHWVVNGYGNNAFTGVTNESGGWMGFNTATGQPVARLCKDPINPVFDITGVGQSFIASYEYRYNGAIVNGQHQTVLAKGGNTASGGRLSLFVSMYNSSTASRVRVVAQNANDAYSSNLLGNLTEYKITIVRDASIGRIYLFLNGVLDAGFNGGLGYMSFAPTLANDTANTSFLDYVLNITNADATNGGNNDGTPNLHQIRNLQLYITPPSLYFPSNWASTIPAILASEPTHLLTATELP